jgi:transposase
MTKSPAPEIVSLSGEQLEQLLGELRAPLAPATYQLVESLLRTLQWVLGVLQAQKTSLKRLSRLIFGPQTEKTVQLFPDTAAAPEKPPVPPPAGPQPKRKGHGRHGADDYPGARRVSVAHPTLKADAVCPQCLKGVLYALKLPARLVRIVAQPIFDATRFELARWRCALCGAVFTAPAPPEAGTEKYAANVGPMLGLLRYGTGLPLYRTDQFQHDLGVPLPATTQWELIDQTAHQYEPVYQALLDVAAQAPLFHNDDTPMRVQSLRREIAQSPDPDPRTGIFTTGIVAQVAGHPVALFFTGSNHAGENLDQLLQRRAKELPPPLHMCDGLARNESKEFTTRLCHCLTHGRRTFVEVRDNFPQECRHVIESLRQVYHFDAQAKEQALSAEQRLAFHQEHSGPVMAELKPWLTAQMEQKRVEPNSGLGQAIAYLLKRWESLTRFLTVPGAPLDNNICEQILKRAILHRKNSLSYKTLHGAQVGDLFMSLIHTCRLNGINPWDYLMALQDHLAQVHQEPARWLPWNYQLTLAELNPR